MPKETQPGGMKHRSYLDRRCQKWSKLSKNDQEIWREDSTEGQNYPKMIKMTKIVAKTKLVAFQKSNNVFKISTKTTRIARQNRPQFVQQIRKQSIRYSCGKLKNIKNLPWHRSDVDQKSDAISGHPRTPDETKVNEENDLFCLPKFSLFCRLLINTSPLFLFRRGSGGGAKTRQTFDQHRKVDFEKKRFCDGPALFCFWMKCVYSVA
jgi:hypothetical protein